MPSYYDPETHLDTSESRLKAPSNGPEYPLLTLKSTLTPMNHGRS